MVGTSNVRINQATGEVVMSHVLQKTIAIVFLGLVSIGTVQAQEPIHYWSLNNTLVDSGTVGGLDLELSGGAAFATDGDAGRPGQTGTLTIDGETDAFARAANHGEPFNTDVTHTLVLWAKHDATTTPQRWISWGNCCQPPGNRRYFVGPGGGGYVDVGYITTTTADGPQPSGSWEHWAIVRDLSNETITYYRDAAEVHSADLGAIEDVIEPFNPNVGPGDTNRELRLGNQFNDPTNGVEPMLGRLSDVAIFDVALDVNQIQSIMQNGAGVTGPITPITTIEWKSDNGLGDWNSGHNWTYSKVPDGNQFTALLGSKATQTTTVVTNTTVTVNSIQFDNPNSYIVAGGGSVNMAANSTGELPTIDVVQGTHEFQARAALSDDTTIHIRSGATIEFNNRLALRGNTFTKTGSGILAINNKLNFGGGTIQVQSGTLAGNGSIGGAVVNAAGVAPGDSPGILTIDGMYDQTASGTLEIELDANGGLPGTDYDRLAISLAATLDGTIDIQLDAGYTPTIGDAFPGIVTATTLNGTFATVNNVTINGRQGVAVTYTDTAVDAQIALRGNTDVAAGDIDVDTSDLTTSIINFTSAGGTGKVWADGDMDGDGDVDTSDLTTSIINFTSALGNGSAAVVPEPATCLLFCLGMLGLIWRARLRQK